MTPVIGLDVDDVLADLLTPWLGKYEFITASERIQVAYGFARPAANGYVYLTPDKLAPEDLTSWDIDSQAQHPEALRLALRLVNYAIEVQPLPGALAAVEELRKLGRVVFVTACPQLYSAQSKYRWLQQHGFLPGDGSGQVDYFPVRDKAMIRMDFLFDDAMHNVKACAEAGVNTILVRRPHNRNEEWPWNVPGIYAAPTYLKGLISG